MLVDIGDAGMDAGGYWRCLCGCWWILEMLVWMPVDIEDAGVDADGYWRS